MAAASFSTVVLAMSLGLIAFKEPVKGTPSTTYKGLRFPFTEPNPLIRIVAELPGWPDELITLTPATSPAKAWEILEIFLLVIC